MWDSIEKRGPDYGYYQQADKTWVIVKPKHLEEAQRIFSGTNIKITTKGKRHLGAAIGSEIYRKEYINEKIDTWIRKIQLLSEIAAFAPQEAYTCFTSGYKHKLNFCMRTIPSIGEDLKRIDEILTPKLIAAITRGIQPNDTERRRFSLPPSLGGLGIPIFSESADREFSNSTILTEQLQKNILSQEPPNNINKEAIKKIKAKIRRDKMELYQQHLNAIKVKKEHLYGYPPCQSKKKDSK